jgi:hexosaminidase
MAARTTRQPHIGGSLSCTGNTLPPTDDGVPNSVSGQRSGPCATPASF